MSEATMIYRAVRVEFDTGDHTLMVTYERVEGDGPASIRSQIVSMTEVALGGLYQLTLTPHQPGAE